MTCRPHLILLFALVIMTSPALASSPQPLTIDAGQQLQFADTLFNQQQYRRAAEEYQRFAFFFPQDPRQRQARFKAGRAFLLARDTLTAIDLFKQLTERGLSDSVAVESYFMLVECHLQMHDPTNAVVEMNNLIRLSNDTGIRDRAYHRLGWLYIDQTDWAAAQNTFAKISVAQRGRYRVDDLERKLGSTAMLPRRSPVLAGTLSLLPGAGQFYCQRYEDALIAFAVNLGLFWAAHDAFDQDQYALGGLLSFVGLGFYAGNIYSAVGDAHKFNQRQKQRFAESLKRYLIVGSAPPGDAAILPQPLLSFRVRF
jgi:tetratricopeptide (TPR) repeat protein